MVCLIMAYLVPIIMTVIHFSVRIFRKDKVTANFISPFPCFVSVLGSLTVVLCINMIYSPDVLILVSLALVYLHFDLYSLFSMSYLCEDFFVYGFRKINFSALSCSMSGNWAVLYVRQERFPNLYGSRTNLIKLNNAAQDG